jgi:DNA-binding IclR family transcriptional regulator
MSSIALSGAVPRTLTCLTWQSTRVPHMRLLLLYTEQMTSLTTALRVLSLMSDASPQVRVSETARRLTIPKSSVSRALKLLTESGFLERDSERGFRAGPELFRLGVLYRTRLPPEARIDEELRELVRRHGATAYVGVLRGTDLIVLRRHESSSPVRFIQEPGAILPAYATAVGKALLARQSREDIAAALPPYLVCEGREINISRDQFLRELEAIRQQGYAEFDDRLLGVGAVGVAVQIAPDRDLGFAICFTRDAIDESQRRAIACELRELAYTIGMICEDPIWAALPSKES